MRMRLEKKRTAGRTGPAVQVPPLSERGERSWGQRRAGSHSELVGRHRDDARPLRFVRVRVRRGVHRLHGDSDAGGEPMNQPPRSRVVPPRMRKIRIDGQGGYHEPPKHQKRCYCGQYCTDFGGSCHEAVPWECGDGKCAYANSYGSKRPGSRHGRVRRYINVFDGTCAEAPC